jgi:hypothetical protein
MHPVSSNSRTRMHFRPGPDGLVKKISKELSGRRTILLHLSGFPCQAIGAWTGTNSSTSNNSSLWY